MDRSKYELRSLEGKEKAEQIEKYRSDGRGRGNPVSGDQSLRSVQAHVPESPTDRALERYSVANTGMPGREVSQGVSQGESDLALHTQQVLPPHTPSTGVSQGVSQGGTDLPAHTQQVVPPHTPRTGVSQGGSDLAVYTQQLAPLTTPEVSNPNNDLHMEGDHFCNTHGYDSVVPRLGNQSCQLGILSFHHMSEILSQNMKTQHSRMKHHSLQLSLLKWRRIKKLIHFRCKMILRPAGADRQAAPIDFKTS